MMFIALPLRAASGRFCIRSIKQSLEECNGDEVSSLARLLQCGSIRLPGNRSVSGSSGRFYFPGHSRFESAAGMFAVLIGFASIETNSGGPPRTIGPPYLHGYRANSIDLKKAAILANLSGQEMSNPPTANGEWVKQHGV